jgi:acyl-[acyl-carrier-protein] desaturase
MERGEGLVSDLNQRYDKEFEAALWRLYRGFFEQSERRRRWSIAEDIPWTQCNKNLAPVVADIVESFCTVELYLPDYLASAVSRSRHSRAQAWFYANWGYEESKHSLALGDWLLRSGMRSEEQMVDLGNQVFDHLWQVPHDSHLAMISYAMVQERATAFNYRNLRRWAQEKGGDPALEKLLMLLAVDEQAHHSFFRDYVRLFLEHDRDQALEQLRRVMNGFAMPALDLLADGRQRAARIQELNIFNVDLYYREVYLPILESLGITRAEMRDRTSQRKSAPASQSR